MMIYSKTVNLKFNKIKNSLAKYQKQTLVIGVSGGVDSMTLLHFLITNNFKVVVVHFNHHKRKQSDIEAKLVCDFCNSYNVKLHTFHVEGLNGGNFQQQARLFRYDKLKQICQAEKSNIILTAHHLNDQCENVLMHLVRGINISSSLGMKENYFVNRIIYLKPFLSLTKDEILSYASHFDVPFLNDESNFDTSYTRNRIRNFILPLLTQDNPRILNCINEFNDNYSEMQNYLISETNKVYPKIFCENKLKIDNLLKKPSIFQKMILVKFFKDNNININYKLINSLIFNLISHRKVKFKVSDKLYIVAEYNYLTLIPISKKTSNNSSVIRCYPIDNLQKDEIFYAHNQIKDYFITGMVKYNIDNIAFPLLSRNPKQGDRLQFHYGSKKLSRFLIDKKIPQTIRQNLKIVVDQNNLVLWIPHYYLNQELKGDQTIYFYLNHNEKA